MATGYTMNMIFTILNDWKTTLFISCLLCCNYCRKRPRLGTVIPKEPNTHIISAWTFDPGRVASYVLSIAYMLLPMGPNLQGVEVCEGGVPEHELLRPN